MLDAELRQWVRRRAGERCEYCGLRQEHEPFYRFQVEHIIPRQHQGGDDESNLALACPHCNLHKGPNLSGIDPECGAIIELFHPRRQNWQAHFAFQNAWVRGLTATGRATIAVLAMNAPIRLEIRAELIANGQFS